jgi:pantothenate kinase type III
MCQRPPARRPARSRVAGGAIERAVASVRPASTARVVRCDRPRHQIGAIVGATTPMPISSDAPDRVGTDRLCAAAGHYAPNAAMWSIGSAITVDLVIDRRFLGGVILPGPSTSLAALHRFTARLPSIDFTRGPLVPRRIDDTESAMRWGAALGAAGGIRAAAAMLEARAGKQLTTIISGGHAARLSLLLPGKWLLIPDLTVLGLAAIGQHSTTSDSPLTLTRKFHLHDRGFASVSQIGSRRRRL